MIRLEKVNKYFNRHKNNQIHVIDNTSITFPESGLVALLGPSGCGKTTLLNVIGGLDKASSGKIYINNKKISKKSSKRVDKIRNLNVGYIFQDYKLVENMTVFENVALSLKIIGIKDQKEIEHRVLYTLDKVNMLRYKNRPVGMLSGGERQRVGIARALVKNPKIIIADEPTGNLDSKNTIEIMNIIKSISSKYLVVLVTHEEEIARFYADRIVELQDGKIIKDYKNDNKSNLDLKFDNQIHLKDFKNIDRLKKDNINIEVYRDKTEEVNIKMVFKNGNIYIETDSLEHVEAIDSNSNIELINDHYKEIKEVNIHDETFNIESVSNKKYKEKYSSIFKLGSFIKYGFSKVFNYSSVKKVLLLGFFLTGIFVFYSVSSIFATLNIEDSEFVTMNKEYLTANVGSISVSTYESLENSDYINYVLPSDSIVSFTLKYDNFLQTAHYSAQLSGSLSDINMISSTDLIYGRMPASEYEIVVDKKALEDFIEDNESAMVGFSTATDFLNQKVYINNMEAFTIVGITDTETPNIYVNSNLFINIIANSNKKDSCYWCYDYDSESSSIIYDYELFASDIKLVRGNMPENNYEVIINKEYSDIYALNKTIDVEVNGQKLKVVGYYESTNETDINYYLVNNNTVKYNLISEADAITIYSNNDTEVINLAHSYNINLRSSYDYAKSTYINDQKDSMISAITTACIMLIISLVEILLMIRSSFLSRIKEVGIYRAIGVKKSDIYKMFVGEILAITVLSSFLGIAFMTYCLYYLTKMPYIENLYMVNAFTVIFSLVFVLVFNLIVGLFPVYNTIRKTPAQILSRYDVD